ncbi:MAG: hypothetical protein MJZ53_01300 [Paludibacteraceae bacterium]|nr:hypothetical protein [Paludibacteraceae bacterium]
MKVYEDFYFHTPSANEVSGLYSILHPPYSFSERSERSASLLFLASLHEVVDKGDEGG